MSNGTWSHSKFAVTVSGRTYHPYLASEGVWRFREAVPDARTGQRPEFEHLHDLVSYLARELP